MDTNSLAQAITIVLQQPQYQAAFNDGLMVGATAVAVAFGFWMLRAVAGSDAEGA